MTVTVILQLYGGELDLALRTALHLRQYEDLLDPVQVRRVGPAPWSLAGPLTKRPPNTRLRTRLRLAFLVAPLPSPTHQPQIINPTSPQPQSHPCRLLQPAS